MAQSMEGSTLEVDGGPHKLLSIFLTFFIYVTEAEKARPFQPRELFFQDYLMAQSMEGSTLEVDGGPHKLLIIFLTFFIYVTEAEKARPFQPSEFFFRII